MKVKDTGDAQRNFTIIDDDLTNLTNRFTILEESTSRRITSLGQELNLISEAIEKLNSQVTSLEAGKHVSKLEQLQIKQLELQNQKLELEIKELEWKSRRVEVKIPSAADVF